MRLSSLLLACLASFQFASHAAAAAVPACHRIALPADSGGVATLRQAQAAVKDFETLALQTMFAQTDPTEQTVNSLNGFLFKAVVTTVVLAVGRADDSSSCHVCDVSAVAPSPPDDNGGYPWSVVGVLERLKSATTALLKQFPYDVRIEAIEERAIVALADIQNRKKHPYCKGIEGQASGGGGGSICYAGAYVHTGGPRPGKVHEATICIDWTSTPCAFTGDGIKKQAVTHCAPNAGIVGEVFYKGGKSVRYDLALDGNAKLVGLWWQSDGASGEWRPN